MAVLSFCVDTEKLDEDDITNVRAEKRGFKKPGSSILDGHFTPDVTKPAGNAQKRSETNGPIHPCVHQRNYNSVGEALYVTMDDPRRHRKPKPHSDLKGSDTKEPASCIDRTEMRPSYRVDSEDTKMASNSFAFCVPPSISHQVASNSHNSKKFNRQVTVISAETSELNMKDILTQTRCDDSNAAKPPPIPSRETKPNSKLRRRPADRETTSNGLSRLDECESHRLSDRFDMATEREGRRLSSLSEHSFDHGQPPPLPSRHKSHSMTDNLPTRPHLPTRKYIAAHRPHQLTRSASFSIQSSTYLLSPVQYANSQSSVFHLEMQRDLPTDDETPPPVPIRKYLEAVDVDCVPPVPMSPPHSQIWKRTSPDVEIPDLERPPLPQRSVEPPALPRRSSFCGPSSPKQNGYEQRDVPPRPPFTFTKGYHSKKHEKMLDAEHHDYFEISDDNT